MLEQENEQLRTELGELAKMRVELEELAKLRTEVEELRVIARSENEGAFMTRLSEEREELAKEVTTLRDRLATQEGELARLRRRVKQQDAGFEPLLERLVGLFRRK